MSVGRGNQGVRARAGELAVGAALFLSAIAGPVHAQIVNTVKDPDQRCLQCHGQEHIAAMPPAERRTMVGTWLGNEPRPIKPRPVEPLKGDEPATRPSLLVKPDTLAASPHASVKCIECHTDADKLPHAAKMNRVTCTSTCHEQQVKDYAGGAHQAAHERGNVDAPTCVSCHGGHEILRTNDRKAPQNRLNALHMCGDCHAKHAVDGSTTVGASRVQSYLASAHGQAARSSGLIWAATCADCHTPHGVRPSKDPLSSVNRLNIAKTCGKCHAGIEELYRTSVHGKLNTESHKHAAVCSDCHTAHSISRAAGSPEFLADVVNECGECHDSKDKEGVRRKSYYQTYHESYHGQITRLGGARAARCSDCHGSHDILPLSDPASRVNGANLVATCAKCHPGSSESFVKFDPHADYRDSKNYPVLHGVWLYFMIMMSSVFTLFGLHTILWFMRSKLERRGHPRAHAHAPAPTAIRRFTVIDRINHAFVALTFFGLTATGIPLVFSHQDWARPLSAVFGGIEAAGSWHRFFAILLIANFGLHFANMARSFMLRSCSWKEWLFGPNSLVPRWKDAKDIFGMFLWFFGLGKRPSFDRWTYWEKFDYWAEVGGSMIIGGSGLLLWFPVLSAKLFPGWAFNIAMVVHGYEALLAIGFIFTIHFFNAHVRPGVFPVDEVIFNGSMPEHELREQRPEEYKRLLSTGKLEALRVPAAHPSRRRVNMIIAIVSVGIGLGLLAFILIGGLSSL